MNSQKLKFKNASLKVIDLNCQSTTSYEKSIYLEIYPKTYEGEITAKALGASKENATIHLRDLNYVSKENQFKNLIKMLKE